MSKINGGVRDVPITIIIDFIKQNPMMKIISSDERPFRRDHMGAALLK